MRTLNRQPVHTVYGGANLFVPGICQKLGNLALRSLADNGPFPEICSDIMARVKSKLQTEPVEDYRIDFEDGYGIRSDADEDGHARSSAKALAEAMRDQLLPKFIGIRVKPFNGVHQARAIRTLELFLATLLNCSAGALPPNFVITLPKITGPHDISRFADHCSNLESKLGVPEGLLRFEFLVETPPALLLLTQILDACRGRCTAAHFGAYDYMASIDIAATQQHMLHPSCDFARNMMKAAYSGRGIFLADGATNLMPVGDRDAVHRGWKNHFDDVIHSLQNGFYQAWDLHPAQLVSRYAAVYSFLREGWRHLAERLRNYEAKLARATLTGSQFDDAATVRGLIDHLNRAVNCGAISTDELEGFPKPS